MFVALVAWTVNNGLQFAELCALPQPPLQFVKFSTPSLSTLSILKCIAEVLLWLAWAVQGGTARALRQTSSYQVQAHGELLLPYALSTSPVSWKFCCTDHTQKAGHPGYSHLCTQLTCRCECSHCLHLKHTLLTLLCPFLQKVFAIRIWNSFIVQYVCLCLTSSVEPNLTFCLSFARDQTHAQPL